MSQSRERDTGDTSESGGGVRWGGKMGDNAHEYNSTALDLVIFTNFERKTNYQIIWRILPDTYRPIYCNLSSV